MTLDLVGMSLMEACVARYHRLTSEYVLGVLDMATNRIDAALDLSPRVYRHVLHWCAMIGLMLMFGCSGETPTSTSSAISPSFSSGQVAPTNISTITIYAASRFAEQATFGPTPELIAALRSSGLEPWLEAQLATRPSSLDVTPFLGFPDPEPQALGLLRARLFSDFALSASDQLRARVTWALSQFIVVSDRTVDVYAIPFWINLLQQHALGYYDELLYAISVSPAMGVFLNNNQNRPKSAECPHCAPNENFARELMQLFSLGVVKLSSDGQPLRNADGSFSETYTQRDVEELARVLTGWQHDPNPANRPNRNGPNWAKPMVPSTWPPERDQGAKIVMGRRFPAGQSQEKDLRDAIDMLMKHPNIGPFVATRLIQHLVKSNPTPAYVGRVAARFRDNGSGRAGDMKAVVRAVLLDPEARAADDPLRAERGDGKIREPLLHYTSLWRGLGCARTPVRESWVNLPQTQMPFSADSVFSFYAPTDRAPSSNLLAPEQRVVNTQEFKQRLSRLSDRASWTGNRLSIEALREADCKIDVIVQAYASSPSAFALAIGERFFRGAMPYALRYDLEELIKRPQWDVRTPEQGALRLVEYALSTPYYGVIK